MSCPPDKAVIAGERAIVEEPEKGTYFGVLVGVHKRSHIVTGHMPALTSNQCVSRSKRKSELLGALANRVRKVPFVTDRTNDCERRKQAFNLVSQL